MALSPHVLLLLLLLLIPLPLHLPSWLSASPESLSLSHLSSLLWALPSCYFVPFIALNSSAVDRYQVHGRLGLSGKHALVEKQRGAGGGVSGPEVRAGESTQRRIQPPRKDLTGTALH